jgi:hypothetical protein
MSRILKRAAVLTTTAAATLALMPLVALADSCPGSSCTVGPDLYPGGRQIFVDFDVHGSGSGEYVVFRKSNVLCRLNFSASDGPATRGCGNGPQAEGSLSGTISGPQGPSYIHLRW